MEHYLPNFRRRSIEALEADLKDIKEGKADFAERYTEILELDIFVGIAKRKEERKNNAI